MSTQWRSIHLVVSFITLAVAVPWLSSAPVLAQSNGCNNNDPGCLANNPDILGGNKRTISCAPRISRWSN